MVTVTQQLGNRLRELRQGRGWSLDQAAEATQVSKAMLGQIERGESSPTLATLWKIATGFRVSFTWLVSGLSFNPGLLEKGERLQHLSTAQDLELVVRFPFDPVVGFEWVELTLAPGAQSMSDAHEPGVTEHLLVIQGVLELQLDGQWHRYETGDTVRFDANQPHGYRNPGPDLLVFEDVIHYRGV